MSRITAVDPAQATGKTKELLNAVQAKLGITPNLMKTLAHSPSALEGYLNFSGALSGGVLNAKFREAIALAVAQANSCEYCLSAHSAIGKMVGLKPEEIAASRESRSASTKVSAGATGRGSRRGLIAPDVENRGRHRWSRSPCLGL